MKRITLLITLCLTFSSFGQNINFAKSFGNSGYDYGRDIKQDIDTGYIATGSSSSFGSQNADAFLMKIDSIGTFQWSYNYGGSGYEWGESVVVTKDSAYALAGYTNSIGAGGFDFYLVRTANDGVPTWEKQYGGSDWDKAYDLVQLNDSGFVLVGETFSYGNGNNDVYIIRTDKNGDTLWTRTYGGTEADYANAVLLDGDSIVIVGGTTSYGNGMTDGLILKYHIDGTFGWMKTAGEAGEDYFTSATMYPNGDYVLGGTKDYDHWNNCDCGNDFWVYKTDNQGNMLNDGGWNGESVGHDITNDVVIDSINNKIYYAGATNSWNSNDGLNEAFIGKLSQVFGWNDYVNVFGANGEDLLYALDNCYDRGTIAIGNLEYGSVGGANILIVKTDFNNTAGSIVVDQEVVFDIITLDLTSESPANNILNIYPTIVQDIINIKGLNSAFTATVYSGNGQLVQKYQADSDNLNLSGLTPGFYVLQIEADNSTYIRKIIKR